MTNHSALTRAGRHEHWHRPDRRPFGFVTTLALDGRRVTVLFAHRRSWYFDLPVNVYDERRDARSFTNSGGGPVIAHPPCRLWCRMRHFSTAPSSEKDLAFFALDQVRRFGGVMEHPAFSTFWAAASLPIPDSSAVPVIDTHSGWTLTVSQKWWGHRAEKPTWLYIVGCSPREIPELPFSILPAKAACGRSSKRSTPSMEKDERAMTPLAFTWWLEELASRCSCRGLG